ncbi:MAG: hypothetical protein JJ913_06710 [Rhizobiaceae bacterium]|nr:hypothetical protein [Rhizobiaceae bacterium]
MRVSVGLSLASALALALFSTSLASAEPDESPVFAERMHVIYDPDTRSVSRANVRIVDPHPEKNLEFVWEPARGNFPGLDPETGLAEGEGKLVWRVRGSANYDPLTVYSTFEGTLVAGVPHGQGRLEIRTGELLEGEWLGGRLEGSGSYRDAGGNHYEGEFRAGKPHGVGIYRSRDGSIYDGPFVAGLRHGTATVRLPGGTVYESRWVNGREVGSDRPDVMADALIGGLLPAQSGGDAGKTEFSVVVDQRMTAQQEVQYQHLVRDEDVAIYPVSKLYNDAWNGTGSLPQEFEAYWADWENAFAFVEAELATTDGSKVRLDSLAIEVSSSDAYRKPMLTYAEHLGCVGFRPDFELRNHGWGAVRNPRISVSFANPDTPGSQSRAFDLSVDGFSDGTDVSVLAALQQAGVDTEALSSRKFQCSSVDRMPSCVQDVLNTVEFGELEGHVGLSTDLFFHTLLTNANGQIDYEWADDAGNVFSVSEPFTAQISLAVIEVDRPMAEQGDAGFLPPAARRYVDIRLPVGEKDYLIDIPFRGNPNIDSYTARLKISSEMSSLHRFRTSARFADGSVRYSKPLTLFYFKPRTPEFMSQLDNMECTLY